jgi:hypothetical protein
MEFEVRCEGARFAKKLETKGLPAPHNCAVHARPAGRRSSSVRRVDVSYTAHRKRAGRRGGCWNGWVPARQILCTGGEIEGPQRVMLSETFRTNHWQIQRP